MQFDAAHDTVRIPMSQRGATAKTVEVTFDSDHVAAVDFDAELRIRQVTIVQASKHLPVVADHRITQAPWHLRRAEDSALLEIVPGTRLDEVMQSLHQDVFSLTIPGDESDPRPRSAQIITFLFDDQKAIQGLVFWHASRLLDPSLLN
jgi:hypothetical protein